MQNEKDFIKILKSHYKKYPKMQIQDFYKLIYQSEFAGGHIINDKSSSLKYLEEEYNILNKSDKSHALFEDIGNGLCRMHLNALAHTDIDVTTVNKFFVNTANSVLGNKDNFEEKLNIFRQCCNEGVLQYDIKTSSKFLQEQKEKGYRHISHSEEYRNCYNPSYRVVGQQYAKYFEIFTKIDSLCKTKDFICVAIEGRSASGKSTLAELISGIYDCNIFHTDNFFLTAKLRAKERLKEAGGNIDYERFYKEVIKGLQSKKDFTYQIYECSKSALTEYVNVMPKKINIIEGAYSMHPKFIEQYEFKIFLHIDKDKQSERILYRNGEDMRNRFINEWIPMEEKYFKEFGIKEKCDLIYNN